MSQVKFPAVVSVDGVLTEVDVTAGWDRPMKEYFMSVLVVEPADDQDEVVWSAMYHPDKSDKLGPERLELQLRRMEIEPPPDFWDMVRASGKKNEGNMLYQYKREENDGAVEWKMDRFALDRESREALARESSQN